MRLIPRAALLPLLFLLGAFAIGLVLGGPEIFFDPCPGVHLVEDLDGGCRHHNPRSLGPLFLLLGGIALCAGVVTAVCKQVEEGDECD